MLKSITLATAIALGFVATADAQEVPSPFQRNLTGGIICDTSEQVEVLLTGISLNNGQFPTPLTEGCGSIRGSLPANIVPTHWYETPMVTSLIAQFTAPNGWVQYGWIDYIPNPDWASAPKGQKL